MTTLSDAQALDALGFNIVPASVEKKHPIIEWKRFQEERTTSKLPGWFGGAKGSTHALCIVTGQVSGVAILDADSPNALAILREVCGDAMDLAPHCRSPKAARMGEGIGHYYFSIGPDQNIRNRQTHDVENDVHWDIRGEGGIAILPPSIGYEWIRPPVAGQIPPYPVALDKLVVSNQSEIERATGGRSLLAHLLSHPGTVGGRPVGRNEWFTRVMGHYAKEYRTRPDMYALELDRTFEIACGIEADHPFTEKEAEKSARSIWESENEKPQHQRECGEGTGYLVAGEDVILAQVRLKDVQGNYHIDFEPWSDFDLRALGVVEDDEANRTYDVEIRRKRQGDTRRALLPAKVLADGRKLGPWLAEHGVGILPPDQIYPKGGTPNERLRRYLEHQDPPHFQVVSALGWHDDGFVVHEGVIKPDGLHGFGKYKPDPKLLNWAQYRYGFAPVKEAMAVLREVLTFHDEIVCAVFGSWWVTTLLKPQIHQVTSQFPFMALEAPSESGKTTGFFPMMLQLSGNTQGQIDPTRASLRDFMSAHQSGIVWIDDLSDVGYLMDLLRQATGEGSVAKKGEDRTTQEVVRLVSPICISGEALQLHHQKALMDRAVMIDVPSPTSRRSFNDPEQMQWSDILAMRERHPDLTAFSGTIVAEVLARKGMVSQIPSLVPETHGRWGDKIAVMRMGARLLADMVDDPTIISRVETWVERQQYFGNENTLTMKLLPAALGRTGWPNKPMGPDGRWPASPVFVEHGTNTVWFSPMFLAEWWMEIKHGHVEPRVESAEALTQQARALGLGGKAQDGRKKCRLGGDRGGTAMYWKLSDELSKSVLQRSKGETTVAGVDVARHRQQTLGFAASLMDDLPEPSHD